jgi:hypothetical protein
MKPPTAQLSSVCSATFKGKSVSIIHIENHLIQQFQPHGAKKTTALQI